MKLWTATDSDDEFVFHFCSSVTFRNLKIDWLPQYHTNMSEFLPRHLKLKLFQLEQTQETFHFVVSTQLYNRDN